MIFSSLDYSKAAKVLPLLLCGKMSFINDYQRSKLSFIQVEALMANYFGDPNMHPIIFPTRLLFSRPAIRAILPRINEYQPGVVTFLELKSIYFQETPQDTLSLAEKSQILQRVLGKPDLYGDFAVAKLAHQLTHLDSLTSIPLAEAIRHIYFYGLEDAMSKVHIDRNILDSLKDILNPTKFSTKTLENITGVIKAIPNIDEKEILHLVCMVIILGFRYADEAGDRPFSPTVRQRFSLILTEFLKSYRPSQVPPFLMEDILWESVINGMRVEKVDQTKVLEDSVEECHRMYPHHRYLGNKKHLLLESWNELLHKESGHRLEFPSRVLSFKALLQFWSKYKRLRPVVKVNPVLPHEILIQLGENEYKACSTMACFLEISTKLLMENTFILDIIRGIQFTLPFKQLDILLKTFCRLFASNYLYLGHVGFPVDPYQLCWFGNNPDSLVSFVQRKLHRLICQDVRLNEYYPKWKDPLESFGKSIENTLNLVALLMGIIMGVFFYNHVV